MWIVSAISKAGTYKRAGIRFFVKIGLVCEIRILTAVPPSSSNIAFHAKDEKDTYQYLGDFTFDSEAAKELTIRLFSTSAADMSVGKEVLTNIFAETTDVRINFSTEQKKRWKKKIKF